MASFYLDGSVPGPRIYLLNVGAAEVVSVLVRKRNAGTLSIAEYSQAVLEFEGELVQSPAEHLLSFDNGVVVNALAYIMMYAINATDAIVLRVALDVAQHLRNQGDDLVLVASDQRLLRAAQAEGMVTFNPETQDQVALASLVGPKQGKVPDDETTK